MTPEYFALTTHSIRRLGAGLEYDCVGEPNGLSLHSFRLGTPKKTAECIVPAWAIQLRSAELEPIAAFWHVPGVEALQQADRVWLRGQILDDDVQRRLSCLPCDGRYEVLSDGSLRATGRRLPHGRLPAGTWRPLHQFLTITLPPASIPALQHSSVDVRLVPSIESAEPDVLLTDLNTWVQYANSAPQVRLKCCQFAVANDGRVLVCGTPLPPIVGTRAVARSGLVVPCGWSWAPAVEAELLATAWGVTAGDLWLMWPGQPIERIPSEQLVAASRAAVQQTWEAVHHARAE